MPMSQRARIRADIENTLYMLKKRLLSSGGSNDTYTSKLIDSIGQQFNHMQIQGDDNFCFELTKLGINKDDFGMIGARLADLEEELSNLNQQQALNA